MDEYCLRCRRGNDLHFDYCPDLLDGAAHEAAMRIWKQGAQDGREGREPQSEDSCYLAGWAAGDIAADRFWNVAGDYGHT